MKEKTKKEIIGGLSIVGVLYGIIFILFALSMQFSGSFAETPYEAHILTYYGWVIFVFSVIIYVASWMGIFNYFEFKLTEGKKK